MGQTLRYHAQSQWITEGAEWRPPAQPPIILRDAAGTAIGVTQMTTMMMTLYEAQPPYAIVAGVENVNVLNTRGCSLSSLGVFQPVLLGTDTVMVKPQKALEYRTALIQFTYASGAKSDALELQVIIQNLRWRPGGVP